MALKRPPAKIKATVTISGPAEEVLRSLMRAKISLRTVSLSLDVDSRFYNDLRHVIPVIQNGETQAALEKLDLMSRQTVIDEETDRRLDTLIKEFGRLTE